MSKLEKLRDALLNNRHKVEGMHVKPIKPHKTPVHKWSSSSLHSSMHHLHVIRREYACPIPDPPRPPILLILRPLGDGDDVALLEPKIPLLIRVESEEGPCLIFA